MGLFSSKRSPERKWGIDWDSPELQPIKGVSLQTYIEVTQTPTTRSTAGITAKAQRAGVSTSEWTEAYQGWMARVASNPMVQNAAQLIMDPDVTPGRTHGV
jgi:hypothetical protein